MKGKTAKHILAALIAIPLLAAAALFLYFFFTDETVVNGSTWWYAARRLDAYLCVYHWDGTDAGRTVEIPDEIDGRKITALGGGNAPFYIDASALYPEHAAEQEAARSGDGEIPEEEMDGSVPASDFDAAAWQGEIVYVDFTLRIGKNIKSIWSVDNDVTILHIGGREIAVLKRVRAECDPENKVYYAENGVLYLRSSGAAVEGFRYLS